jgi:putative ABC transport system permease protein
METLLQDLRYGLRLLAKSPGFTLVAVITLALGIGANSTIFSIFNAVLLRPLPFPQSQRLVLIWATNQETGSTQDVASYPNFEDWKAQSQSCESMAAFTLRGATLSTGGQAQLVPAVQASAGFFETLGVQPAIGRAFRADEQEAGRSHVVLLSDLFWKRHFARKSDVLGQTVRVNEENYTIVGVMPPGFEIPPGKPEQIYVPMIRDTNRTHGFLMVLGRLRPQVSMSAAQAEMNVVTHRLAAQFPKSNQAVGANVVPLVEALVGNVRTGLLVLLGVVVLVLAIACTNVASLMLARSTARRKEMAVRVALGAGRARVVQQLLVESILLAFAGGGLGLLLASESTRILVPLLTQKFEIPRITNTHIDAWVLGFTVVVSAATGILFGIVPALGAASADLNQGLRESSRTLSGDLRGRRARAALVITEMALALVLLAGAGVLLNALLAMRRTPPGFRPENLLTVDFSLPRIKFANPATRQKFFDEVLTRVGKVPGVDSAALVADLPLGGGQDGLGFHIVGRPDPAPGEPFEASFNITSPGYFHTMGIPLRAGREFAAQDSALQPGVIVINETAARRFWPGEDPLGKQIKLPEANLLTVIGIAGDVRQLGLGIAPRPEIFLNYLQPGPNWPWLTLVAHATTDPKSLAGAIESAAKSVDHEVPIPAVHTMNEVLSGSLDQARVYTLLLGLFASLALVLAGVGLYGVISYAVTQRTHEMGIRMALGAARSDILRLVLRQGLSLACIGALIGLAGALSSIQVLGSLVQGVRLDDPLPFAAVTLLLLGAALTASYVPARRATKVDPMVALRYE